MNKVLYEILDNINEGIIILNHDFEVIYLNDAMQYIIQEDKKKVLDKRVLEVLPSLRKKCFQNAFESAKTEGLISFFSAAIHKELMWDSVCFNLKISGLASSDRKVLLLEFIDVTSKIQQIGLLKSYVKNLCVANKDLEESGKTIKKLAYYDRMTGVANRTLLYKLSDKLLKDAKKNHTLLGLMFLDVNKFKSINDTYGHEVGDKVLIQVAKMLRKATKKNDVVGRYGGDEFLVFLPDMKDIENHSIVVSRLLQMKNELTIGNHKIPITFSLGFSFYPNHGDSIDTLIKAADETMYVAKRSEGDDRYYCGDLYN